MTNAEVMVAVPTRGNPSRATIDQLTAITLQNPGLMPPMLAEGHMSVFATKNAVATRFLAGPWAVLVLVDDDVVPPPDMLALCESGYDVTGAAYPVFVPEDVAVPFPAVYTEHESVEGYYSVLGDGWSRTGLVECDAVGFGCVAIHRRVLEQMEFPFFVESYQDGTLRTDDFAFCRRAKQLGFTVAADFDRWADHRKTVSLLELMQGVFSLETPTRELTGVAS